MFCLKLQRQEKRMNAKKKVFCGGCLLGVITFLLIYGADTLDFTDAGWAFATSNQDLGQHQLGWEHFRASEWYFPIGLIDNIVYPEKLSVVYMDSIPLFAFIFKVFAGVLPEQFIYLGIFAALCYCLQGGIGALIAFHFTEDKVYDFIFAELLLIAPAFTYRSLYYTSLGAHWLILLSWLFWLEKEIFYVNLKKSVICWGMLSGLSVLIHPYLVIMVFGIMGGCLLNYLISCRRIKYPLWVGGVSLAVAVLFMWISGYFYGGVTYSDGGLGDFSFNLLQFFDPDTGTGETVSYFLPQMILGGGNLQKWEGFSYLGLGVIIWLGLVIAITVYTCIRDIGEYKISVDTFCYVFVSGLFLLLALSPRIICGEWVIGDVRGLLPKAIQSAWGTFRASGRLIWPVYYLLLIWGFKKNLWIIQKGVIYKRVFTVLFVGIFVIQLVDVSPQLLSKHHKFSVKGEYVSSLKSDAWKVLGDKYNHLMYFDSASVLCWNSKGYDIQRFAIANHMTVNTVYTARSVEAITDKYKEEHFKQLEEGKVYPDYMYIFLETFPKRNYGLFYYKIDDYLVGVPEEIQGYKEYDVDYS